MTPDHEERPELRVRLDERLAAHDKAGAVSIALEAIRAGTIDLDGLYEMLGGLLADVGSAWQDGTLPVWEEHLVSGTVRTIIEAAYPLLPRPSGSEGEGRTVVLACPQDEAHDLGLRMLSDRFEMAGWHTHFLGADTPVGEIAAAASMLGADLIVLSASTHFHRMRIRSLLDELHAALPGIRVVVGGAAFSRDCCGLEEREVMHPEEFLRAATSSVRHDGAGS